MFRRYKQSLTPFAAHVNLETSRRRFDLEFGQSTSEHEPNLPCTFFTDKNQLGLKNYSLVLLTLVIKIHSRYNGTWTYTSHSIQNFIQVFYSQRGVVFCFDPCDAKPKCTAYFRQCSHSTRNDIYNWTYGKFSSLDQLARNDNLKLTVQSHLLGRKILLRSEIKISLLYLLLAIQLF